MKTKSITIDREKCKQDGLCSRVCGVRMFSYKRKEYPEVRNQEECVLCGECIAVCPTGAITHSVLDKGRFKKTEQLATIDPDVVASILQQRRSVRAYKKERIPRDVLEKIARVAGYAPTSAHGGEGWTRSCIIVSGKENMRDVRDLTAEYLRQLAKLLESFMVRLVSRWNPGPRVGRSMLPDIYMRLRELEQGRDAITYDAPHALFFHSPTLSPYPQVDCDAAMYSVMLLAHAKGMGTCWNGWLTKAANGFRVKSFTALKEMLGFPAHHEVFSAATLGYRALDLHSVPPRETKIGWVDDSEPPRALAEEAH
jgi:nitroreductase/NAD-dependent dihydropyrimidine dehydrogenase PreA subunit